jgi:hypothetical protein
MPYTYCHVSKVTKQIFYYGKGSAYRSTRSTDRGEKWNEFAKDGFDVEILAQWKTHEEACEHEKFLIWCAWDMGMDIANKRVGGSPGAIGNRQWLGTKQSPEWIAKSALSRTGKKMRVTQKMRDANTTTSNPMWKGYWITPQGIFETCKQAAIACKVDTRTIRARCNGVNEQLVSSVKFYPPKDGWSFQPHQE